MKRFAPKLEIWLLSKIASYTKKKKRQNTKTNIITNNLPFVSEIILVTSASHIDGGLQAPIFFQEPLPRLVFSNDTGSQISCSAHGNPPPVVTWVTKDGTVVTSVPGLRYVIKKRFYMNRSKFSNVPLPLPHHPSHSSNIFVCFLLLFFSIPFCVSVHIWIFFSFFYYFHFVKPTINLVYPKIVTQTRYLNKHRRKYQVLSVQIGTKHIWLRYALTPTTHFHVPHLLQFAPHPFHIKCFNICLWKHWKFLSILFNSQRGRFVSFARYIERHFACLTKRNNI